MTVTLTRAALERCLESAVRVAESSAPVPAVWAERAERMGECPSKTYVALLGVALLARATDAQLDPFAIRSRQPNGYSARLVAAVLAGRARLYAYHLGTTSPEPLNSQPWFALDRVDGIRHVRPELQLHHELLLGCLSDLATRLWGRDLVRFDDTELPGFRPTIGYVDLRTTEPERLLAHLLRKLRDADRPDRRWRTS